MDAYAENMEGRNSLAPHGFRKLFTNQCRSTAVLVLLGMSVLQPQASFSHDISSFAPSKSQQPAIGTLKKDPVKQSKSYRVPLRSGELVLQAGTSSLERVTSETGEEESQYVIVLYENNLRKSQIKELENLGIQPLSVLYQTAWLCRAKPSSFTADVNRQFGIAAVAPWKPQYKIPPSLSHGTHQPWAVTKDGRIKLLITFFGDVDRGSMKKIVARYGSSGKIFREPAVWAIEVLPNAIPKLINEPSVRSVEEGPRPFQPLLDHSRALLGVDQVQVIDIRTTPASYSGLTGAGINVTNCEAVDAQHPDFWNHDSAGTPTSSRFLDGNISDCCDHGTHTMGIIAGNGWNSDKKHNGGTPYQWRGMAPEAQLINTCSSPDIDVSNHSYVLDWGAYDVWDSDVDQAIHGKFGIAYRKPHVWAVANQGSGSSYDNEEGYYSIYASAKNAIGVGAVDSVDGSLARFSSLGPTFDGRIKPDVMAAGMYVFTSRVNIDYIRIIDAAGHVRKSWEFDTKGDLEGWFASESWQIIDPVIRKVPPFGSDDFNGSLSFLYRGGGYGCRAVQCSEIHAKLSFPERNDLCLP